MNKSTLTELTIIIITIFLVFLLFNPFQLWMPMTIHLLIIAILLVTVTLLGFLLIKQLHEDEREQKLRLLSSQAGYMSGILVLITGVIFQSFSHQVDSWLVISLVLMFTIKAITMFMHHIIH